MRPNARQVPRLRHLERHHELGFVFEQEWIPEQGVVKLVVEGVVEIHAHEFMLSEPHAFLLLIIDSVFHFFLSRR